MRKTITMQLDAIIISDSGISTYSETSPLRLKIKNQNVLIQTIKSFFEHHKSRNRKTVSWLRAPRLNGITLYDQLQKKGFKTEIINNFYDETERFVQWLAQRPKFIIISTTYILSKPILRNLTKTIKVLANESIIICGGPFVFASYLLLQKKYAKEYDIQSPSNDYLFLRYDPEKEPLVDYYIISQSGLETLTNVMHKIAKSKSVENVPNLAYKEKGGYSFNTINNEFACAHIRVDWQRLPPYLFDYKVMSLQASNGCPYDCAYCNFVKDPRATYIKPIDTLVAEMKVLQNRQVRYVRFVDDNFRLGTPDVQQVCQRFIKEKLTIKWMSFFRLNNLTAVDFNLLQKAGCIEVQMGLESANHQVLKNMNKRINPDMYLLTIKQLLSHGINVSACFIIGFPGESKKSVADTINFINRIDSSQYPGNFTWNIFPFMLAPLSPIYEPQNRAKYGLRGYMLDWEHDTMNSETANRLIKDLYLNINRSTPTYSGDDLDLLLSLPEQQKKHLLLKRYELSKQALKGIALSDAEIINSFSCYFASPEIGKKITV